MTDNKNHKAVKVHITGLVQGVGFRPFIYRLAHRYGLTGWVENRNDGVFIKAEGDRDAIDSFIKAIITEAPAASAIEKVEAEEIILERFTDFRIVKSSNTSDRVTDISPDIAVCDDCLEDLKLQPHRIDYPFVNCTNCGPRFLDHSRFALRPAPDYNGTVQNVRNLPERI